MQRNNNCKSLRKFCIIAFIVVLCAFMLTVDILLTCINFGFYQRMLFKTIQQFCGVGIGIYFLYKLNVKLLDKPQKLIYLLPCCIIAVDNFQFCAFFSGKLQLVRTDAIDFILFFINCLSIGLFEEIIFRGVIFSVLAGIFSKDRKGFLKTYVVSSLLFGLAHLFNGFSIGAILQVGYTILTGGLFGFCLIKTKNILCCAFVHGLYNFCGLLFDTQGLGNGVIFDIGTVWTMLLVSVLVGVFVLYKVWTYSEEERLELYARLGA